MIIFTTEEHFPAAAPAGQIAEVLSEIMELSQSQGWSFLAYLVDMARYEALIIEALASESGEG
ncbi:hypothetical protein L0F51_00375 [Afifella sp. H1R]|uniref:hypothetical protein n=1 Tax=Afifella sp. H1R TaxID=2908841 RepID=UPI001F34824B|nr:hypothetical protein [Afifella sp. H1R]MCF1502218.1 hypothetical protein [Afifella sp. H1R]